MNTGHRSNTRLRAFNTAGTPNNNRALPLFCALAVAVIALFAIPSTAGAFGVSGFTFQNGQYSAASPIQAAAHTDTTISFSRTGSESEDLKDVLLDMPTGVFANPESANPKCTQAQFTSDSCPANSQVGTVSMDITAASLLNITAPGSIDILTPDPGQVATLGITVRPAKICIALIFCAVPDKVYMKTGVTIKTYEDSGLRTYTPGATKSTSIAIPPIVKSGVLTLDITVKKLTLAFQSRSGTPVTTTKCTLLVFCTTTTTPPSGPYFWTQTGSCDVATAALTVTSYSNQTASATSSYTPTGCPSVPFSPSAAFVPPKTSGGVIQAGLAGPVSYTLNIPDADAPIQNSLPKIVDIDFPNGSGLDLNALSGVTACSEDQLKAQACPASSIIGTANAFSKYLPPDSGSGPGLAGNVYAMSVGNQVDVGVQLLGPRGTVVIFRGVMGTRGDAAAGTGHVYSLFNRIPQLPFRQFNLTFTKPVYKNPDSCQAQTVHNSFTGFSGATAASDLSYTTTGCAAAPDTTISNGPPSTTTNRQPTFTFSSTIAGSSFQCKVDSGSYTLCTSPYTIPSALADGSHTFSVYACNGLTCDATPASSTFTVSTSNYSITLPNGVTASTTQAAAHPDITSTVNVSGGQPKSVSIKMPSGLNASLTAVTHCSTTDAAAGTCPAASKVGTLQLTADTFSGPVTGLGDVYLTDAPTANDAGGVAVKVPLGSLGDFIAQGGAYLVNNGNNQNLEIRNFPTNVGGTDITITQLVLGISGANRFLTNPSNCTTNDGFVINSTKFDGTQAAPVSAAFQATGCTTVPFSPSFNINILNPNAGQETGIIATLNDPQDNSTVKTMRVTLPPSLGPNFPAFGQPADQCPSAAAPTTLSVFDPTNCPPQAKVGVMTINTPLLPTPLTGDAYLINKSPLPWFGVKFDQPGISVRLVGVTSTPQVDPACDPATDPMGFCQSQISTQFSNLPDVPLSSVVFALNGPSRTGSIGTLSGNMLVVASPGDSACATGPAKTSVVPHSGAAATQLTQTISVNGC